MKKSKVRHLISPKKPTFFKSKNAKGAPLFLKILRFRRQNPHNFKEKSQKPDFESAPPHIVRHLGFFACPMLDRLLYST